MSRSTKKGPWLDPKILKKIEKVTPAGAQTIKTWARGCEISPEMVGHVFAVHNGKDFIEVRVNEDMVGHRLGEFSPTRKFIKHGGKIQKEIDMSSKQAAPAASAKK